VLTNLTELLPLYKEGETMGDIQKITIEDCINSAYKVIAQRKGKMIGGTFVKENS